MVKIYKNVHIFNKMHLQSFVIKFVLRSVSFCVQIDTLCTFHKDL